MFPVIEVPSFIKSFVSGFDLSYHSKKHMARYVTGLVASFNKTIKGITNIFLDKISNKALNRFLSEYQWDERKVNKERLAELQKHNETRWSKYGILAIDDTKIEKTGEHIPFVYKLYDSDENRFIEGQNIVTLHYADRKIDYPIDYRIYNDERTKIKLAKELIEFAVENNIPGTFEADSWFFCREIADLLDCYNRQWTFACKSSLLVRVELDRFIRLDQYFNRLNRKNFKKVIIKGKEYLVYQNHLYVRSLQRKARILISIYTDEKGKENILFLITNRNDYFKQILADYLLRFKIDSFYKDAKQNLGLGKLQARNVNAITRHFYLVFLAHSILRLGLTEGILGKLVIKSSIGSGIKRTLLSLLEKFSLWLLEKGKDGLEVIKEVFLFKYRQS